MEILVCGARADLSHLLRPAARSIVDARPLQLHLSFELVPLIDGHTLYLIDFQVSALEFQPVTTAGNRQSNDGRLQAGGRSVDPEIGPGV